MDLKITLLWYLNNSLKQKYKCLTETNLHQQRFPRSSGSELNPPQPPPFVPGDGLPRPGVSPLPAAFNALIH